MGRYPDPPAELYRAVVEPLHALADALDPEDVLRRPFRLMAEAAERRLKEMPPEPVKQPRRRAAAPHSGVVIDLASHRPSAA